MADFLSSFNERQREVVTHDTGPLLVISGAGTGKTHVLTGRILYLIQKKHTPAGSILALTFNEKAATEMMERVDNALPLGHPAVSIHTFHAFCERILRDRGFEIGISNDYKLLQNADLLLMLKRHANDFTFNYYHTLGGRDRFLMELSQYVSRLQDEDISPDAYLAYAKGITASAKTDEEKENAEKHLELAHAYETYEQLLLKNNYMDFGGLLYYTLRLFEKRKSVLSQYQAEFRYVLVDEFQDTNFAQNKIVTLLAQKHQNLCVVGDDDQSIYKWRGASLTNINFFRKHFPKARTVVLNENYRSTQAILDASYALIQNNNPDRLEATEKVDKRLIAVARPPHADTALKNDVPEINHFSNLDDEVSFVVTKANGFLRKGKDVAILVRTNALAKPFIEALSKKKISFQFFATTDIWNRKAIKDCIATLRVIADPWDDVALFRLASLPFWEIPMESLLEKMKKIKSDNTSLFSNLSAEKSSQPDQASNMASFKKHMDELIEFSRTHSVGEVLGNFLRSTGYLEKAAQEDPGAVEDIAAFSDKVASFENTHPHTKVSDFLFYAQLLEESGEGNLGGSPLDPTAIKILTVHGAKGLEFDCVFLPGLAQNKFPTINRKDPFEVPVSLIPESLPMDDHHIQEERRLFYVAITRAKEILTISYSDFYDGKRQWKPSIFLAELLKAGKAVERNITSRIKGIKQQITLPFEDGNKKILYLPKLSYSQIDTFSSCPLKYQFRYLFQIPAPIGVHATFGVSIHNTLKSFYEELRHHPNTTNEDLTPLLSDLYNKSWIGLGYESRAVQEDQKQRGLKMLINYYKKEQDALGKVAFIEEPFSLKLGNLTISGRIDRIDKLEDGTYEVIDYKTGKVDKNIKNNLQLSLYALACRDVLKIPVSKLSLYFISELEKVSTTRNEKEMEKCTEEVLAVASEMSHSDFAPSPGFQCRYCEYRLICPSAA